MGLVSIQAGALSALPPDLELDFEGAAMVLDHGSQAAVLSPASVRRSRSRPSQAHVAQPQIQFEAGSATQRGARLIPDSHSAGNNVLEFWVTDANVATAAGGGGKSRVQMNLYGNQGASEVYQSVRMYLFPEMAALRDFPRSFQWLTVSEWWNDAAWAGEPHPFRITVNLQKPQAEAGGALHFGVDAQAMAAGEEKFRDGILWRAHDRTFPVPTGQWMHVEYYYRQGDATGGKFRMAVTPDGGDRQVLFDMTGHTHHPSASRPDGLRHFNPVKLYTSALITDFLKARGSGLRLAIDDLRIWACRPAVIGEYTACAQAWEQR